VVRIHAGLANLGSSTIAFDEADETDVDEDEDEDEDEEEDCPFFLVTNCLRAFFILSQKEPNFSISLYLFLSPVV